MQSKAFLHICLSTNAEQRVGSCRTQFELSYFVPVAYHYSWCLSLFLVPITVSVPLLFLQFPYVYIEALEPRLIIRILILNLRIDFQLTKSPSSTSHKFSHLTYKNSGWLSSSVLFDNLCDGGQ